MRATDIDLDLAKKLWVEGKTDIQVSEAVGVPLGTLRAYKRKLGLTAPRAKKEFKPDITPQEPVIVPPHPTTVEPVDLHLVLNEEEIYLHAESPDRALELLSYLTTIIQREGAADHAAT